MLRYLAKADEVVDDLTHAYEERQRATASVLQHILERGEAYSASRRARPRGDGDVPLPPAALRKQQLDAIMERSSSSADPGWAEGLSPDQIKEAFQLHVEETEGKVRQMLADAQAERSQAERDTLWEKLQRDRAEYHLERTTAKFDPLYQTETARIILAAVCNWEMTGQVTTRDVSLGPIWGGCVPR